MDRPVDLPPRSPSEDVDVPPVDGGVLPADDAVPRSSADAGRVPARPLGEGVEPVGLALLTDEAGRAPYAARAVSSGVDGSKRSGDAAAFCHGFAGGERRDIPPEAPLNVAESVDLADEIRESCAFLACVSSHSRITLLGCLVSGEKPIAYEVARVPVRSRYGPGERCSFELPSTGTKNAILQRQNHFSGIFETAFLLDLDESRGRSPRPIRRPNDRRSRPKCPFTVGILRLPTTCRDTHAQTKRKMAAMMCSTAMLARTTAPRASVRSRAVKCAAAKPARQAPERKSHNEAAKKVAPVLGGVAALGLAQVLAPGPAAALSITDPVFGDIEVWQFIVLTAGYWLGIEYYLEKKYDEPDGKDAGAVMPKVSEAKKSTFAEATAKQEEGSSE